MEQYNTNVQGRELDWNDEIEQESSFVLLPEGNYRFKVEKFDRARHSGSTKIPPCNKAVVFFTVSDSTGNSTTIKENLFLHTSMEWKLSEFFAAIGMKNKGEKARMNWGEVYGKTGVCHVIVDKYTKNDGSEGKSNKIDKLFPSYDNPTLTTAPTQQPAYNNNTTNYTPQQQSSWKPGNF